MKRLSTLLCCGLIAFALLPGCGSKPESNGPKVAEPAVDTTPADGDWLISRLGADMPHLNPYTSSDAGASRILSFVFDSLLDRDNETMDPKPKLAESWSISEDHLTYTFKLREGAVFSDGTPLTAEDVKFSFDTMVAPTTDAPHLRNYFADVTACELVDDSTIRFTCSKPYYRHIVMLGGFEIIPKHIYGEGDFNTHPMNRTPLGSGPYILETWDTGKQIVLVRNEQYWGEKPHIFKRIYKIISDDSVALQVLERGDLDSDGLRPEDWVRRCATPEFEAKFNKFTYYAPQYSYIGWNSRKPQFSDKRVRRALTMLLDRDLIRETIYEGLAKPVAGNFMPGMPEHNDAIQAWPFDPEGAKKLLDETGWTDSDGDGIRDKDGVKFAFEILIANASSNGEKIATIYQEELKRVGIDLTLRPLEWATMLQSVDGRNFDATMMGWSMPPDPDPYQVWHSTQIEKGSNYVGFNSAEADALVEQARTTFEREERIKLYHRFQEIIHDEQPYTFLFQSKSLLAVDKRVHGITMYPYGPDSLEWYVPKALHRYE